MRIYLSLFFVTLFFTNCSEFLTQMVAENDTLDGHIEGLSSSQLQIFLAGDEAFSKVFTPETGLGPFFVTSSCNTCHPGDGKGHPSNSLTRFGKLEGNTFDHLLLQGGPQLQHRALPGLASEIIPLEANGISQFVAPAVTGLGFLEAVTDADILEMADPLDLDGDGISGVPNYLVPPEYFSAKPYHIPDGEGRYIGRFGKKAGAINLLIQTVGAYNQDMGITSEFELEDPINYSISDMDIDGIENPELPTSELNQVVFYLQTLKAPLRRDAESENVLQGEQVFAEIGCESCHRSSLQTGDHIVDPLSNQTFHPYTDLLMHDMGPALDDNYTEGTALTSEWKTPALWGLGLSKDAQGGQYFLMHDGRANSIEKAIEFHGGEAQNSASNFDQLSSTDKDNLIAFLESL
ncbi:MAG: c-type cytochrome [Reichenbachiella sp.]